MMYDWSQILHQPALLAVLVLLPVPNLWAIYHAFYRRFPTDAEKMIWICVGIFVPILGGVIYFFTGRKRAVKP